MDLFKAVFFVIIIFGSGALSFYFKKDNVKLLKILLSFTGAYILGITFMHLIPAAYSNGGIEIGLFVILGFLLQLLLEGLSKGVEHGHMHINESRKNIFAFQVLAGLCIHAFFEGMPLAEGMDHFHSHAGHDHSHHHHNHGEGLSILGFTGNTLDKSDQLYFGIIAHHMPAALALGALFLHAGFRNIWVIGSLLLFALMTPLGAFASSLFTWSEQSFSYLLAAIIGAFLHISTTILFEVEDAKTHTMSKGRLAAVLIGLSIAVLVSVL